MSPQKRGTSARSHDLGSKAVRQTAERYWLAVFAAKLASRMREREADMFLDVVLRQARSTMPAERTAFLSKLTVRSQPCFLAIWEISTSVNPALLRLRPRIHWVAA